MERAAAAGDRQQSKFDGEKQNQNRAEGKVGNCETEQREEAQGAVGGMAAAMRGEDAGGDGDCRADDERQKREL